MGQGSSQSDGGAYGPFAIKHHINTCHVRQIIAQNDFIVFLHELKFVIKQRESIGFVSQSMVESMMRRTTHTNSCIRNGLTKPSPQSSPVYDEHVFSELDHDVLSYRAEASDGEFRPLVFIRCNCAGRYAGMNINQLDSRGQAALHVAVRKRDHEMLTFLLNLGANAESVSKWGLTPLIIACETGDLKCMQLLMKAGANPDAKEDQNLKMFSNQDRSPLIVAALHGHVHCVSALISAKADLDEPDTEGNTPIHKSAVYGHTSCVKLLIEHGCQVNCRNKAGASALQLALMQSNMEVVRLIVQAGCDVTDSSSEFPPILTLAAMTGEVDILHKCIKSGFSVDMPDISGRTPLYYTFTGDIHRLQDHFPAIKSQGITLDFHFAQFAYRKETFKVLVEHGANVEAILKDALSANILTVKHFTLPQNIELFKICLGACGFGVINDGELETLFWKLVSRNCAALVMVLMQALPRLGSLIAPRLSHVVDWTGVHTHEAVVAHLESVGSDYAVGVWIARHVKQAHSLQSWCRQSIRKCISPNVPYYTPALPLPRRIKTYIELGDLLLHYNGDSLK